jgi:uncharacterized protein with PQ loop repeat
VNSHVERITALLQYHGIILVRSTGDFAMDSFIVAANILGVAGAIFWSIQLIPQIILNYRRHNAIGLQPTMMMLWAWAGVPLGVYNIVSRLNIALQVQPQILTALSLITWAQCYYYERSWSPARALVAVISIAGIMAGIEFGLIVAINTGLERGLRWPLTLMAALAALFLALGVLRHYFDIWKHRSVRGISFLFVALDALGDLTSLLSVLFQPEHDILGIVIYGVELTLWIGIFACGGYYNLLPWLKSSMLRASRESSDNVPSERDVPANSIAIHNMPSSTSVFQTPSSDLELRNRRWESRQSGEI